jgi:transaldolase
MAQPEFVIFQPLQCPQQVGFLLLGCPQGSLVDAPVVDGIHPAHSTDGILWWNGLGQFPVFFDAFVQDFELGRNASLKLRQLRFCPVCHIDAFYQDTTPKSTKQTIGMCYFRGMKFFIDTANLDQIREAEALGVLDGVTTNPSLMAKEGITGDEAVKAHYKTICEIVDGDVSAEVISTEFEGMIAEGQALAALHPNIVVKVPAIADGIRAIRWFTDNGIRTNCTLIFSPGQALLAAKAGASYVSPFVGRIDDISSDGLQLIEKIRVIYDNYDFGTEILAASVRHTMHIIECAEIGADIMTGPLSAIKGLLKHPLTDNGLAQFLADHAKAQG